MTRELLLLGVLIVVACMGACAGYLFREAQYWDERLREIRAEKARGR